MIQPREISDQDQLPGITYFNGLRHLFIAGCFQLTDQCLINGLALCTKLKKITLCHSTRQFTKDGLNSLQQARNYHVLDMFEAHTHGKHDPGFIENPGMEHKRFIAE